MLSKIYIEDIDVVKVFINECMECLQGFEKEVLKLEVRSEDMNLLSQILEKVKRIKRESSFVGISGIVRLSHEIEVILEAIRDKKATVDTGLIDSLLSCIDFLDAYIKGMHEKLKEYALDDENGLYLENEDHQKEEQLVDNLRLAYENCKNREDQESKIYNKDSEEKEIEILQSEEFKKGLTEGIKEQFLIESMENIDKIENDLLMKLDSNSDDREALSELFRMIHSIKGGAAMYLASLPSQNPEYFSLKKLSEVVHTFESLLVLIRDKGFKFENNLIDLSFLVIDYLKSIMSSIISEEFIDLHNDDILDEIKGCIS